MEKIITFEMKEKDQEKIEELLDDTLAVLRRLEKESPEREVRIAKTQAETEVIKKDIQKQLAILTERTKHLSLV